MPARSTLSVRGPSSPIVKLASAPSRRFALLRPRYVRLAALTPSSANLMRQLSTAHPNSLRIDTHATREPLDDAHRRRYCEVIFCRLRIATPSASPDAEHTNRRPQVTVRSLLSTHSLVAHSRDDTSADHAIAPDLPLTQGHGARSGHSTLAHVLNTSGAHVPDLQS